MGKLYNTSQVRDLTYGSFSRQGVSVDLTSFLSSARGQQLISALSEKAREVPASEEPEPTQPASFDKK
jgi:hypothetical protein